MIKKKAMMQNKSLYRLKISDFSDYILGSKRTIKIYLIRTIAFLLFVLVKSTISKYVEKSYSWEQLKHRIK